MSFDILGQVVTNAEARFNKIHIRKVYACLAVTCHLHFWQNDRDFLRATVVTRGWNGYRNKSQHRKSTLEKKILPPFQQGFEPATFQSRVRCSNHWAIPAPPGGSFCHFIIYTTVLQVLKLLITLSVLAYTVLQHHGLSATSLRVMLSFIMCCSSTLVWIHFCWNQVGFAVHVALNQRQQICKETLKTMQPNPLCYVSCYEIGCKPQRGENLN